MANASQIISFLQECYQADNRELTIFNLYSSKVEQLHFLSGREELLDGIVEEIAIHPETIEAIHKAASLYKKNKVLLYGAFIIAGRIENHKRLPKRICSPLFFYPATILQGKKISYLKIDISRQRINFPLLTALLDLEKGNNDQLDAFVKELPEPPITNSNVHNIVALFKDFFPKIESYSLYKYPNFIEESKIKTLLKPRSKKALQLMPGAALALLNQSIDARGILAELGKMAKQTKVFSSPLKSLLAKNDLRLQKEKQSGYVPAVLSAAQQKILHTAATEPITLAIGPPGTGKSYTIAALALDHLSRGESVLIASRMDHAVDVVAAKIEEILGQKNFIIRGGDGTHMRELTRAIKQLLSSMIKPEIEEEQKYQENICKLEQLEKTIAKFEKHFKWKSDLEQDWGKWQVATANNFFSELIKDFQLYCLEYKINKNNKQWLLIDLYESALKDRAAYIRQILQFRIKKRLCQTLIQHRSEFLNFLQAIKARSNLKQSMLFEKINKKILLGAFPIWMVTLADVHHILPLSPELFDLVIIDEASQCDIASCFPMLFRAKRLVITGDPHQLNHLSFLSQTRQQMLAEQYKLNRNQFYLFNYRTNSILDLVNSSLKKQENVHFLDEHFRSMPQIIAFSNKEFYQNKLKVMTSRPNTLRQKSVKLHYINSKRNKEGVNEKQAQALIEKVVNIVKNEAHLPQKYSHCLGVLSPFRDQVDYLFDLLNKNLSISEIQKHQIIVGTSHTFQGEERDIMFLSFVLSPEDHPQSFRFLSREDIFNVAITRARNEQYIYYSIKPEEIKHSELLRRFFEFITTHASEPPKKEHKDTFLQEVIKALESLGFKTWPAYNIADFEIDLMAEKDEKAIAIDLIGYPGDFSKAIRLERYRMFQRAGLRLFPLPYSLWCKEKDICLQEIQKWLELI